ncbi:hypothetical protein [Microbacterium sp. Leaf179]|uniref:hypothetical protein n=1 Tax=Microbacterium sp. Leaf179 TaxID=1736288 RepID=UPI0006FF3253|nr:hypothetical protein [Microbacterium sp. Leaf179]KQR86451.1 hypothetical protein ASF96_08755 [Microbacterium sp. Leaf179]
MTAASTTRLPTLIAALSGVVAVCAYAGVALLQILVWNPEAARPGLTAAQVWAEVGAANQGPPGAFVVGVIAIGPLFALVLALLFVLTGAGVWSTIAGYLGLLFAGMPGYFVASFGPGMGLADTYLISGGDFSPGRLPLYAVSALSVVALLALFVGAAVRSERERRTLAVA